MNLCEHGKSDSERKKYCQRPGPPYSASDFSEGDTKRGNDGNMYIINVSKKGVKQWKMRKNTAHLFRWKSAELKYIDTVRKAD